MTKECASENNAFKNNVDRYENWFKRNEKIFASEIAAIKQLLPDSGSGIEIGVGTGLFASALGIRDGVEPSREMAELAMIRGINVVIASAEQLPLSDGVYQFALMVTVDCFLEDVRKAFREIRRILTDNGSFVIAFIDRETNPGRMYEQRKSEDEFYSHASFHSSEEISGLLKECGFELIDQVQTIFSMENTQQEVKPGSGEGVFAVIKAVKQ